ncbi:MAG: DUF2062 domain-containing protein [Candidatus Rokubacteria bacterium]|nr:DUF2062 domain-containing protein [Candidatus Rokubacteria bacterium]
MVRRLLDRVRGVLQLDDAPWRIALALALGVFLSCTPTFGFQTLLALLLATVTGLNRAAMVCGVWINLPWVTPFVYAGALTLGAALLPDLTGIGGMSLMLLVGTTIIGVCAGAVTYLVSYGALSVRRERRLRAQAAAPAATPARAPAPAAREPAA